MARRFCERLNLDGGRVKNPVVLALKENAREFINDAREWAAGKNWLIRLPLWLWFVYITWGHAKSVEYGSFLEGLNLGIHEFGHLIFMPFGQFVGVAGGSFFQCLVPVISIWMFYRQGDFFAYSFSLVWLGTNLHGVARYIGDARAMQLDLVSPFGGGDPIHDWHYLLQHTDLLNQDTSLARIVNVFAFVCLFAGVAWGGWILWQMLRQKKKDP